MGYMNFVYTVSQSFWQSVPVLLVLVAGDFLLFTYFVRDVPLRFEKKSAQAAAALVCCALYFFLYLQYYAIAKHCILLLILLSVYLTGTRKMDAAKGIFLACNYVLIVEVTRTMIKDGTLAYRLCQLFPNVPDLVVSIFLLVCCLALLTLLITRLQPVYLKYKDIPLSLPRLIILLLPFALYMFLRNIKFDILTNSENPDESLMMSLEIVEIAVAGLTIAMNSMLADMVSSQMEVSEHLRHEMLLKSQEQQYMIHLESINAVNRKYHDLKHMLAGIRAMNTEDAAAFAEALEKEIQPYECVQETGNTLMNILLSEKIRECQEKKIRLVPFVDASAIDFMAGPDLCSLFGNAMDNAIEASAHLPEAEREIHLKLNRSGDMIVMQLQNRFDGKLMKSGSTLLTRKENRSEHGFGTENILRIAEKYNGSASFENNNTEFTLNVLLPLPQE